MSVLRTQRLVGVLRVLLVLAFAALLVGQLRALPAIYDGWVRDRASAAGNGWLLVAEAELLCVQVVIVCTWRLLTMVRDDRIFSDAALVWVDTIVGAMAVGWVLLAVAWLYALAPGGPPGLSPVLLALLLVAGAVVGLLMVVMRALLRQATRLRTELDAVV